jgi:hypothetical protein
MPRHETPMIKKIRYGSLVYNTLFDTLNGDVLTIQITDITQSPNSTKEFKLLLQICNGRQKEFSLRFDFLFEC